MVMSMSGKTMQEGNSIMSKFEGRPYRRLMDVDIIGGGSGTRLRERLADGDPSRGGLTTLSGRSPQRCPPLR